MTKFDKERMSGIGGSDIAAIMGVSEYRNALDVYNSKKGISPLFKNINMDVGIALENLIKEYANSEFGLDVSDGLFVRHNEYDFIIAHTDGFYKLGTETGVLEYKTSLGYNKWGDDVPVEYYLQLQHYMLVTGLENAKLVVLYLNNLKFDIFHYKANKEVQENIISAAKDFWNNYILKNIPPENKVIINYNNIMHNPDDYLPIDTDIYLKIEELKKLQSINKDYEKKIDIAKEQLKNLIGAKEGLSYNGKPVVTYKGSEINRFDIDKIKHDNPELYFKYTNKIIQRRLIIK